MGMYDNLFINIDKLPVSEVDKVKLKAEYCFQTKDFECVLTEIYVTDEGELKVNEWKYEEVPKEERPHPDENGILGLIGSIRRTGEHLITLKDYHGYVNFLYISR